MFAEYMRNWRVWDRPSRSLSERDFASVAFGWPFISASGILGPSTRAGPWGRGPGRVAMALAGPRKAFSAARVASGPDLFRFPAAVQAFCRLPP